MTEIEIPMNVSKYIYVLHFDQGTTDTVSVSVSADISVSVSLSVSLSVSVSADTDFYIGR